MVDMNVKEKNIIRSTSPDDLTMDQRYALTLRFADLVMRAKGYERVMDPDANIEVKSEKYLVTEGGEGK